MPTIYDNIDQKLAEGLRNTLVDANRLDACVGYFNLRGWGQLAEAVDDLKDAEACRLLVGMSVPPDAELRAYLQAAFSNNGSAPRVDAAEAHRRVNQVIAMFHEQLVHGSPSNRSEAMLRKLVTQLRSGKLTIRLFVRYPLHAKLYLVTRNVFGARIMSYVGSSNLTLAGLSGNGELNVDVADQDAATKLQAWFDERWNDRFCIDIGDRLIELIEASWAGDKLVPPYHVYLKMAYHLAEDAREGLNEFRIPSIFGDKLYEYQEAAVRIAARYLNQQGGVMIGDVVGLGKTLMATALARLRQEEFDESTLILCPPNLVEMWQWYRREYELVADVLSTGRHGAELKDLKRYRLVLIDESHNLRSSETRLYGNIRDYIERNGARCILLSATPYNKHYSDLAAQLGLFVSADQDLGIRPEAAIRAEGGEIEFARKHPVNLRTMAAFRQSKEPDDWRDLMRRYLVRRTRTFIKNHYTSEGERGRPYLLSHDGTRNYFPDRIPKTAKFETGGTSYGRLIASDVVDLINKLNLPRYGLGGYIDPRAATTASASDRKVIDDLGRAGVRLKGFTRTNLFKRLESSGDAFLLSIRRHALKNEIFLYALRNDLPVPIGKQAMDDRLLDAMEIDIEIDEPELVVPGEETDRDVFERAAEHQYHEWDRQNRQSHTWLPARLFDRSLQTMLATDVQLLREILEVGGEWSPHTDPKLIALRELIGKTHPDEKVLVFTQYADTANYLVRQLGSEYGQQLTSVTSSSGSATAIAHRFSPRSNNVKTPVRDEIRVLISTDVLSEGQNLQDSHIVVNYDIPWAIIRLIQRVGRIDRIGQQAEQIVCYSFLPAEGIEQLINLRGRVRQRLGENAAVVGADERFFEGDDNTDDGLVDLYNERSGILDDEGSEEEVDLASFAFQIWKDATDDDPALKKAVERLDDVIFATKQHTATVNSPAGALIYVRSENGVDALARIDEEGNVISESALAILRAAACGRSEVALPRSEEHHRIVKRGVQHALASASTLSTGLGSSTSVRHKVYARLSSYHKASGGSVLTPEEIRQKLPVALERILNSPLRDAARQRLSRALQQHPRDEHLAELVIDLMDDDRLVVEFNPTTGHNAVIKCSMGLRT